MNEQFCKHVQAWLLQDGEEIPTPPPALSEHVAGCPKCLGALAALATTFWHIPVPQQETMCSDCQRDLAAYIELERLDPGEAVRTYPEVWWHLWTCVDCSEHYELTRALLTAQEIGELAPLPVMPIPPAPALSFIERIRLSRARIHQLLTPHLVWGESWGSESELITLVDQEHEGYRVSITAQKQLDTMWTIIIQLDPPASGRILLTIGSATFGAEFANSGQALIQNISELQLTALEGPDIFIDILGTQ